MRVVFSINYNYDAESSCPCKATVTVKLPVAEPNKNYRLHPLLRSAEKDLWGWRLSHDCGYSDKDGEHRYFEKTFSAANWSELDELVSTKINEAIELLKEVKAHNEAMLAAMPQPKTIEVEI